MASGSRFSESMHILTKTPRIVALLVASLTWLSCGRDARDLSATGGALTSPISSTSASNDDTTVTYVVTYTGAHQYFRVYVDTDRAASTGFRIGGLGADFLTNSPLRSSYRKLSSTSRFL